MTVEPRRITARSAARSTDHVGLELIIAIALIVIGLIGAANAMQSRPYLGDAATNEAQVLARIASAPNVGSIAVLFLSIGAIIIGLAWLLLRLIHRRFFAPVAALRVWRQAFFAALFIVSGAWLQLNRSLTLPLAAIMLVVLVLVEVFLNVRGA
jgi:diacylglycerol kinase